MTWITAKIEKINPLSNTIVQLLIQPTHYISYQAGQYLQLRFGDYQAYFSIANAPMGASYYELHIRHSRDNPYHQPLFAHIKRHGVVSLRLPLGECHVNKLDPAKPILFIAGGTGFAPIKAMIEQLLADGAPRPFELFWGARTQSDLYMDEKTKHWQTYVKHFEYFPHQSDSHEGTLVERVLVRHCRNLLDWQIVIGGPFDMAYHIRDALIAEGVLKNNIFSDAFDFLDTK